jgi:hypothetical protein
MARRGQPQGRDEVSPSSSIPDEVRKTTAINIVRQIDESGIAREPLPIGLRANQTEWQESKELPQQEDCSAKTRGGHCCPRSTLS